MLVKMHNATLSREGISDHLNILIASRIFEAASKILLFLVEVFWLRSYCLCAVYWNVSLITWLHNCSCIYKMTDKCQIILWIDVNLTCSIYTSASFCTYDIFVDFLLCLCRVTQLPDGIYAKVQLIVLLSQLTEPI